VSPIVSSFTHTSSELSLRGPLADKRFNSLAELGPSGQAEEGTLKEVQDSCLLYPAMSVIVFELQVSRFLLFAVIEMLCFSFWERSIVSLAFLLTA